MDLESGFEGTAFAADAIPVLQSTRPDDRTAQSLEEKERGKENLLQQEIELLKRDRDSM